MIMSWKMTAIQLALLTQILGVIESADPVCKTCNSSPSNDMLVCNCDDQCSTYRDCCPDAPLFFAPPNISDSLRSAIQYMTCQNRYKSLRAIAVGDAYYMVSSCPANWTSDIEFAQSVSKNCTSSAFEDFPPVSDTLTGITYRNEFCATCHNVNTATVLTWSTRLRCRGEFANISQTQNITLELIQQYCPQCTFDPPNNTMIMNTLRWCIPVESPPQCQLFDPFVFDNETEYNSSVNSCINGDYHPIFQRSPFLPDSIPYEKIFRNSDCARCNGVPEFVLVCIYPSNSTYDTNSDLRCTNVSNVDGQFIIGALPFSAVLDVRGSGIIRLISSMITEVEVVRCEQNQIFDPVTGCRNIVCPVGFTAETGMCSPIDMTNNDIMNYTINCTTVALNASEYIAINDSFVLFREEVTDIVGYDADSRPIVCVVGFNRSGELTTNTTVTHVLYPRGFTELTYVGTSLSIIASVLILFTYSVFKELRTLPSKLLMNLAMAFLLSDLLLILSGIISQNILSIELCSTVAIVLHFLLLGRFSWMNCLGIEYTRTFILALKLRGASSTKSQTKFLIGYMIAGWGLPLLITGVTIVINYTVNGAVLYGTDVDGSQGLCWINEQISSIAAFVVPISISTLVNVSFFVTVAVLICISARTNDNMAQKQQLRYVQIRVVLAIFSVLGLTWIFGFIALLSNLAWAWYPFIILNSTQAVLIAIGFLATKRILSLYISLFTCMSRGKDPIPSSLKTSKLENMGSLDTIGD